METLFVTRDSWLKQKENTLSITINGKTRSLPIEKISHLVLLGEARLNSRLLTLCGKHGVRLSVFDFHGYFKGAFEPLDQNPSGKVKLAQSQFVENREHRLALAKEILRGAFHNMRGNLQYYQYRGNKELKSPLTDLRTIERKIHKAKDSSGLMGYEGNFRQCYYSAWKTVDPKLGFGKRVRRPPNNPINCLISFLNQLTYTVVRHEIFKTHLEESFSFLHAPGMGRPSLSLDLAELFKPVLADTLIFKMVRKKMVEENWFDQQDGVCLLTETGRRHVAEQFSKKLEEPYQEKSYRQWIYREALSIERHVLGMEEYESFKKKV